MQNLLYFLFVIIKKRYYWKKKIDKKLIKLKVNIGNNGKYKAEKIVNNAFYINKL